MDYTEENRNFRVGVMEKSGVFCSATPSTPETSVSEDTETFAAVSSCVARRRDVKLPEPVGTVVVCVTVWLTNVGVGENAWSNMLATVRVPALSRSTSVDRKPEDWSSMDMVWMWRTAL